MSAPTLLRPLGPFERLYYRYAQRNPMHFVLVAEFGAALDEEQVRIALDAVQRRHVLLSAHVEDRRGFRLAFFRASSVAPIPLRVYHSSPGEWQSRVSAELGLPFDDSRAPLMRAALIGDGSGATILLAFEHLVVDGLAGINVMRDLVKALNGEPLPASTRLPPSQEDMIARTIGSQRSLPHLRSVVDLRMAAPAVTRPYDRAARRHIHTAELTTAETARLIERCRAERTTVHAAIVAVGSRVRGEEQGETFVRTVTPLDLRDLIGAGPECVDYHTAVRTGLAPHDGSSVWDQARSIRAELIDGKSASNVAATSVLNRQFAPIDLSASAAEAFLASAFAYEMRISNLGVQDLTSTGPIRPHAIWGPITLFQLEGEYVIGVLTYHGQLRMVTCGHNPTKEFQEKLRAALLNACAS